MKGLAEHEQDVENKSSNQLSHSFIAWKDMGSLEVILFDLMIRKVIHDEFR